MGTPSVKQLQAFWWAAHCVNFVTAAERLHLSLSSLSKRLIELEIVVGQPLFDRTGQKAVLTDVGRRMLPATLTVLEAVAAFERSVLDGETLSGQCKFGVGDLSALTWLPTFVNVVRQSHPALLIEPHVDVGGELERRLADGELDFAVIAGLSSRNSLVSVSIGAAHFEWAILPTGRISNEIDIPIILQSLPLITLPPSAGTTRLLDDWLLSNNISAPNRITCNSWMAVAGMVCKGLGVGFLPEGWAQRLGLKKGVSLPLKALQYSFQHRRGEGRVLVPAMQKLIQSTIDFTVAPCVAAYIQ